MTRNSTPPCRETDVERYVDELINLWANNQDFWTDQLTAAAAVRKTQLLPKEKKAS